MTLDPLVTVGVPVRNGCPYLAEALGGICKQTYNNLEIIISDNASTDATPDVCADLARSDKRVRYCRQREDIGMMTNLNTVLAKARGELFMWAAHDDVRSPAFVETLRRALFERRDAVLAHSWTTFIDAGGNGLSYCKCHVDAVASSRRAERMAAIAEASRLGYFWETSIYGLMRSRVAQRIKPMPEEVGADSMFVREMARRGPFIIVPSRLFAYRVLEGKQYISNGKKLILPGTGGRVRHPSSPAQPGGD